MTDEVKLLPCPWCGGAAVTNEEPMLHGSIIQRIECDKCFAGANSESQWNTRVPDPRIAELEAQLENWRELFGCESPEDAVQTTCEKSAGYLLGDRNRKIHELQSQLNGLRSQVMDVTRRIGVAANPAWIRGELERITNAIQRSKETK